MSEFATLPPTRAMIGKWSVDRYVAILRRWTLAASAIVMFLGLLGIVRTWPILIELALAIFIGIRVARRGGGKTESLMAGAFVGISLGLASSLGRFLHHPTVASGLMIIIETALTVTLALLVTVSASLLSSLRSQQKN